MINSMKEYDYYVYEGDNEYGQPTLSSSPVGTIKMNINITSQMIQDNVNYSNCNYIGLTHNKQVNDTWVIEYGDEALKVQYVNPKGRLNQVFMVRI